MHFKVCCTKSQEIYSRKMQSELFVYYGDSKNFEIKIPELYSLLSNNEQERANRFKYKTDFNCYVSVHALLRVELCKLLNINIKSILIEESKNGKPSVSGSDMPFSLSRSKNYFTFIIGKNNQMVGIDIEQIKREINFADISRNYFSPEEQHSIYSLAKTADQIVAFFEIWTRKEALLKAMGIGINTELNKVQVLDGENHIDIKGVQTDSDTFNLLTILNSGTIISVASSDDFYPKLINLAS